MTDQTLTLTRLKTAKEVSGFLCQNGDGACDLEDFLRNDALDYEHTKNISRTYLGWHDERLVGFFTLSCGSFRFHPDAAAIKAKAGLESVTFGIPVIVLARLAVDDRHQKRGIGSQLFKYAVRIARERVASQVGCRYLFVDAYAHKEPFYAGLGCEKVGTPKTPSIPPRVHMLLDLAD